MVSSKDVLVGDKFKHNTTGTTYVVVNHIKDDVIFIMATDIEEYKGDHLFYDTQEDIDYALSAFGIKMELVS